MSAPTLTRPANDHDWAAELAQLDEADRLAELGFTEKDFSQHRHTAEWFDLREIQDAGPADQLGADRESPNVITDEWLPATISYPDGRRSVTATFAASTLAAAAEAGAIVRLH